MLYLLGISGECQHGSYEKGVDFLHILLSFWLCFCKRVGEDAVGVCPRRGRKAKAIPNYIYRFMWVYAKVVGIGQTMVAYPSIGFREGKGTAFVRKCMVCFSVTDANIVFFG